MNKLAYGLGQMAAGGAIGAGLGAAAGAGLTYFNGGKKKDYLTNMLAGGAAGLGIGGGAGLLWPGKAPVQPSEADQILAQGHGPLRADAQPQQTVAQILAATPDKAPAPAAKPLDTPPPVKAAPTAAPAQAKPSVAAAQQLPSGLMARLKALKGPDQDTASNDLVNARAGWSASSPELRQDSARLMLQAEQGRLADAQGAR